MMIMQALRFNDIKCTEKGEKEEKSSKLKEGLLAIGKFLKNKVPMKETAVAIGIASMALPACTTRFEAPDIETEDTGGDAPADIEHDDSSIPDLPSEIDEPDVEDANEESVFECRGIFSQNKLLIRVNEGETERDVRGLETNDEEAGRRQGQGAHATPGGIAD